MSVTDGRTERQVNNARRWDGYVGHLDAALVHSISRNVALSPNLELMNIDTLISEIVIRCVTQRRT